MSDSPSSFSKIIPNNIPNNIPDADLAKVLGALLEGLYTGEARLPHQKGGRIAALEALKNYNPKHYSTRNYLDGNVSRLSPYLRHGMLGIVEVADHARTTGAGKDRAELLRQLSWREFFALAHAQWGDRVLENLEEPKYRAHWTEQMPDDLEDANTDLPCVDAWVKRLKLEGWLHNHERMWFAAYVVHFRKVHWKAGYRMFREHLLDGDVASNALSWQWVASSYSQKPYFMNKENIERYSHGAWCRTCTAVCPFDASYETLERRLFGTQP